tara:strand:+ start:16680 stop:17120 length:441 start_codon:yes stop_codon:yes gene_type:complete
MASLVGMLRADIKKDCEPMRRSRQSRVVVVLLALISILFMQLAMASYVCQDLQFGLAANMMSADVIAVQDCHDIDAVQPNLCDEYAYADKQVEHVPHISRAAPFVAIGFALPVLFMASASQLPTHAVALTRATAPSLAIGHCCFRI